jgi:hypothetical protein
MKYNILIGVINVIDVIASDLFEIEESAMMTVGILPGGHRDNMLGELHLPVVSELLYGVQEYFK